MVDPVTAPDPAPAPDLLVLANADAGSHDEEVLDDALGAAHRAGVDVEVARTASPEEVRTALGTLDGRVAVAAGGDGTLHVVVQALHDRQMLDGTVVGLVPLGTGNDFARSAGIPLEADEAVRLLLTGRPAPTDLLLDDEDTVVVNAVHAGVGADASHRASELKDRLGAAAYPVGALVEGATADGFVTTIEVDGVALVADEAVLLAGVGNGAMIGGGTRLFPDAVLDDGQAEVVACLATGVTARVGFGRSLRAGDHGDRDDVRTARGTEVVVRGEAVRHAVDGEVSEPLSRRRYRLHPAAWTVIRPT
jgi:YegS/Rv2252/BmrU family lipid kinase